MESRKEAVTRSDMRLPDFLIIGAMKAGTTTLYRDLLTNPAVYMPIHKEPNTLCDDAVLTDQGREAYAQLFAAARPEQICGEASTAYTKMPVRQDVPQRAMKILGPDVKLVYLMREPLARLISHHHHMYGIEKYGPDINEEVLRQPDLINFSRYAYQAAPWIETFGPQNIKLIRFEDFVADRRAMTVVLSEFLGISPRPELINTAAVFNKSQDKPLSTGLWKRVARSEVYRTYLRPLLPLTLKDKIRSAALPKGPPTPPPPSPATVQYVYDQLAEDMEQLRVMLGYDGPVWPRHSRRYDGKPSERTPTEP